MRRATFVVWLLMAGATSTALAHKPTVTTFTYHKDIYPIFEAKCGSCHRTGGVAPMSLLTYREAFPWAVSIKNEVLHLAMPPWSADDRYGSFKHSGSLSAEEMDTIVDWCLGGSPEGDSAERVSSAVSTAAPGEPDLVLEMPEPVLLDADTSEAAHDVVVETGLAADTLVAGFEFLPGAANVVRGVSVSIEGGAQPLTTWVPGQPPSAFTSGHGHLIPAGAKLRLHIRYKKTWLDDGSPVEDRSRLALYFAEGATAVETISAGVDAPFTLASDRELVAMLPWVGSASDAVLAELVLPDGTREPLLRLHRPSPDWPRKYWLQEPVRLPAGSRVEVTATDTEDGSASVLLDLVSE